jgi:LuxR family maltose regulon positive regulatory protein
VDNGRATSYALRADGDHEYPLLATKLLPPKLPGAYVPRDRLLEALTVGVRDRPLTLVSAAAGSGKSVLATSWFASSGTPWPAAWLGIDDTDDRAEAFWTYALEALIRRGVSLPHLARPLRIDEADDSFVTWLAADLLQQPEPVVLILDDADRLASPIVLNGLDFLLTHAAPRFRLVMCCRADPVLPLHRYRLSESLAEIRTDALAFTDHEAKQLLKGHGVPTTSGFAAALNARTGGWVGGLRLAAMALERSTDGEALVTALQAADSTIAEYLITEVLERQSPELREILLRTSVSAHLWPGLVDELTGRGGGMKALAAFDHANVFLETGAGPDDGSRRLRPLLREVLQAQLAYESPELVPELHRRCARWLAAAGQLPGAIAHAVTTGDYPYAAALLVDGLGVGSMLQPPDIDGYGTLFEAMPQSAPGANTALVRAALALARNDPSESLDHLARAEELAADDNVHFRLTATVLRAVLCAETVDINGAMEATAEGELLLSVLPVRDVAAHPELRALLMTSRGTAQLWQGDADVAERTLADALAASTKCAATFLRLQCMGRLALLHAIHGRLRRAHEFGNAAHELATEAGLPPRNQPGVAALALAWAYALQYRDEQSRHWLVLAEESAIETERRVLAPLVAVVRARLAPRGVTGALRLLASFDPDSVPIAWMRECLVAQTVDLYLTQRRPDLAKHAIAGVSQPHSRRIRLAVNRLQAVEGHSPPVSTAQLHDAGAELDLLVAAWLARAAFHLDRHQEDSALKAIEQALRLAEPERVRRPFVECSPRLRDIVRTRVSQQAVGWLHQSTSPALIGARITPAIAAGPRRRPALTGPIAQERLTARELEVLRHLAQLLSTNEIGVTMFVSVNTVRTHVRSILRKLNVSGRNEAVRRAWELNLL